MERIEAFEGVSLDVHRTKLPNGFFQVDQNGDRFNLGSWQRRRGRAHSTARKSESAVQTLIGFEAPGEDFGLVIVSGAVAIGETNVTKRTPYTAGHGPTPMGSGALGS